MKAGILSSVRYVILLDDDVNAFTPAEFLEILYRPFFERALPVSIAIIPNISKISPFTAHGDKDFLVEKSQQEDLYYLPVGSNRTLVNYLLKNLGYEIVQHGNRHEEGEFLHYNRQKLISSIEEGRSCMIEAGFAAPKVFVPPQGKLSKVALEELLKVYELISSTAYEKEQVPYSCWVYYIYKKLMRHEHWKVGDVTLLTTVGDYYFSASYPVDGILEHLKRTIASRRLSVVNSHWWEYFKEGKPNYKLIDALHGFADFLAENPLIKVIVFRSLLDGTLSFREICRH